MTPCTEFNHQSVQVWLNFGRSAPVVCQQRPLANLCKALTGIIREQVKSILQRHLISNHAMELDELRELTKTNGTTHSRNTGRQTELRMTRGKVYFQARIRQNHKGQVSFRSFGQIFPKKKQHFFGKSIFQGKNN